MGHPDRPAIGGGVHLYDYAEEVKKTPGLVICTSSPDRCFAAFAIGSQFPRFTFTYRQIPGFPPTKEVSRETLIDLKKRAMVQIYPLDPSRPSDFFSMAVLEALAAGTPVVVSDADSMTELWGGCALVLSRPILISQWVDEVQRLMADKKRWKRFAEDGRAVAREYDWTRQASRYLEI